MVAIAAQLADARIKLAPVAGRNAALEARLLAAHAWGMSAEGLILHDREMRDVAALDALIARRLAAEPVAQILGEKDFWKARFLVSRDVLTPRADSETMLEALLRLRPDHAAPYRMLDLGTGSGCLILSALGEYKNAEGLAVDASAAALAIAVKNATALTLVERCAIVQGDWCSALSGRFDIILSNPPYIPSGDIAALDADVREHEPHSALDGGADGLDCYRSILHGLTPHAQAGSLLLFEVGVGQAESVSALAAPHWRLLEIAHDLSGIARVVALEYHPNH